MSEEKKPEEKRKKRRRLSKEEKEKFRRKALLLKAIQFKRITDAAILACLLLMLSSAVLPLIHKEKAGGELKVRGWQVVLGYKGQTSTHGLLVDGMVYARVTADGKLAPGRGDAVAPYRVPWYGYAFVGVYPLAALLLLLYLFDFAVSLGRPLPVFSSLFGMFTLGYMLFMVVWGGPFNEFKSYGLLALLLGSFALGLISLLRLPNSSRRRRRILRAAKKGEPLDPFFATPEKEEEALPADAEKKEEPKAGEEEDPEAEKKEEPKAEPKAEEAEPAEAGEESQAEDKEESEPAEAAEADAPEPSEREEETPQAEESGEKEQAPESGGGQETAQG